MCDIVWVSQISVCKSAFPSAGNAVSLYRVKTLQQRPLLLREVKTQLPDCGVAHQARDDHLSRLSVMPPSTTDVNWLQVQPQRLPGCHSQQWWVKDIRLNWPTVMVDNFLHQLVSGSLPSQGWWFDVGEHWKPWERCRTERNDDDTGLLQEITNDRSATHSGAKFGRSAIRQLYPCFAFDECR